MVTPQSQSVDTNLLADALFFKNLRSKNILTKLVRYHQPTSLCVGWNSWLERFRFQVNCFHFREVVFVHVGPAQMCTENGVSICMSRAVEVGWLAQNIRHSSTRVRLDVSSE